MGRERLKTLVLIILAFLSIFFFSILVYGGEQYSNLPAWLNSEPPSAFYEYKDLKNLLLPERVVVHYDEGERYLVWPEQDLLQDEWEKFQYAMGGYDIVGVQTLEEADWWQEVDLLLPALEFVLPGAMPMFIVLGRDNEPFSDSDTLADRIIIGKQDQVLAVYLRSINAGGYYRLTLEDQSSLLWQFPDISYRVNWPSVIELSGDARTRVARGTYIPWQLQYTHTYHFDELGVERESVGSRAWRSLFFSNPSIAREVRGYQEIIYTDGPTVLRVAADDATEAGRLSYTNPRLPGGQGSANIDLSLLSKAADFISEHSLHGWPQYAKISNLHQGLETVTVEIKHYTELRSLPIETESPAVSVQMSGTAVYKYDRYALQQQTELAAYPFALQCSVFDALDQLWKPTALLGSPRQYQLDVSDRFKRAMADGYVIVDIYLGYREILPTRMSPHWVIVVGDETNDSKKFFVNAHTKNIPQQ